MCVYSTLDRKIFTLKIIRVKNFCVDKFSQFCSTRKIFLMVNGYNMDEHLESSKHLVYYQVTGEPGIAGCSRQSDIYLGMGGGWSLHAHLLIDHCYVSSIFVCLIFAVGLGREIINTEIYPIYGIPVGCTVQ